MTYMGKNCSNDLICRALCEIASFTELLNWCKFDGANVEHNT